MLNPFWNPSERRVRAFWRALLYLVLVGALSVALVGFVFFALPEALASTLGQFTATALATWAAARLLDRRRLGSLGLRLSRDWWADCAFGLLLGLVLMAAVFLLELALGWVRITGTFVADHPGESAAAGLFTALLVFLYVGIYEEVIMRGYLLKNAAEGLRLGRFGAQSAILTALVLTSALFGVAHAGNPNATILSTANIMAAGLLLGLPVVLTGRLGAAVGLHITWNFAQGVLFGFPVSGTESFVTAHVIATQQGGPPLWTGGDFGPEGGLISLLAMALGAVLIVLYTRSRYGITSVDLTLAEPPVRQAPLAAGDAEEHSSLPSGTAV